MNMKMKTISLSGRSGAMSRRNRRRTLERRAARARRRVFAFRWPSCSGVDDDVLSGASKLVVIQSVIEAIGIDVRMFWIRRYYESMILTSKLHR